MPSWNWNESQSESGVVHESVANTDYNSGSELRQGYPIQNPPYSASMELYYPFHEDSGSTVYDFSGNNRDGTYNGTTANQRNFLGNGVRYFNGSGDYVSSGFNPSVVSEITVFGWFYVASDAGESRVMSDYDGSRAFEIFFNPSVNEIQWMTWDGTVYGLDDYPHDIITNQWFSGAFRFDSGIGYSYFENGNHVATSSETTWTPVNENASIGVHDDSTTAGPYKGNMAHFMVFNRPFSDSEIQNLHDMVASPGTWTGVSKTV